MQQDIGISDTAYGFGASLFFIGDMLFAIPNTLLSTKLGARWTLSRTMMLYSLGSIALLWVSGARTFALLRFLLGACQAGSVESAMAYFSRWLPPSRMARTLALFSCAPSISGIVSGPLCAWIMTHFGQRSWPGRLAMAISTARTVRDRIRHADFFKARRCPGVCALVVR